MNQSNPMHEKFAVISWCPADIKELYPRWTDQECIDALQRVGASLEDRSIEAGWDILDELLTEEYGEY